MPDNGGRRNFVGSPRLRPGAGFALRRGIWRWALRVAAESRVHPTGIELHGGPSLSSRWYTVGGRRLHARVSDGPARLGDQPRTPAVLVHGVTVSSRYLLPAAVELAKDIPVLVPDLPGYGFSAPAPVASDIASLADAVIGCAVAAGHERVSLVGNSFGAQVVVEAALRHSERVERIVLLGPTVDPAARSVMRQYLRWQRNAPDEHLSCIPVMARDLADIGARRAARMLRLMVDDRIEDKLPQVACPALVVRAGRDRVVSDAWARRAANLLALGELAVVPGYAHMAHYSGPLAVVSVLREFLLAEHAPGAPLTAEQKAAPADR